MKKDEIYSKILGVSRGSYYNYVKEDRLSIKLLDHFSLNELEEFLSGGKITRLELLNITQGRLNYSALSYLNIFNFSIGDIVFNNFLDLYFQILVYAKDNHVQFFSPFSIQKTSLKFLATNNFVVPYDVPDTEVVQKLDIGLEMLDNFDCDTNFFIIQNIFQDFKPLIEITKNQKHILTKQQKVEAYLHAMLFHLYSYHPQKSAQEKRAYLADILIILFQSNNVKRDFLTDMLNSPNISFDAFIQKDINIIEDNYEKIIHAIKIEEH